MIYHATEAAKPLPCSVPLAVVLYGAGNHQPVVSRKVTFARACAELIAEDTAQNAQEFAELTTRAALNRASAQADETAEAVRYAEEQAEIWAHLAYADKWEQIDAHLESNFPELDDDAREAIVDLVCRG